MINNYYKLLLQDLMCKRNGLDPSIKTTYFQHKTNLLDVRTSLFVVAALVTTITFAAGFTLPGGFNQDTGEAILGKKPSFIVFLLSDTLTLVFSMLVLICLTLSMVYEPSKSLILIDRSMVLLRMALNFTLVAFMTGVYIVMSPKSLWATILIIVITSSLIIISINKNVLFKVMDRFFPAANKECKDPMRLVELGYRSHQE
ncbi:ankyrin repeat-containing protein ITN1-like [Chenopodium quinoa]|uniref:ankyrin repeat-containing protein ITN1-like n=1 Tax=Chenopodium quinoa TaxID=63459 RepID=UPI000B79A385|nr:ankyrin repeat-containing protein ITN1-like [Chenopodium quinoa]